MDSSSVTQKNSGSDTSRFEVDGVVAEMMIEVDEEDSLSPSKTLKVNEDETNPTIKTSPLSKRISQSNTNNEDKTSDETKSEKNESSLKQTDDSGEQESVSEELLDSSNVRNTDVNESAAVTETIEDQNPDKTQSAETLEPQGKERPVSDSDELQQCETEKDLKSPVKAKVGSGKVKESEKIEQSSTPKESMRKATESVSDEEGSIKEKSCLLASKESPKKTNGTKYDEGESKESPKKTSGSKSDEGESKESPKKTTGSKSDEGESVEEETNQSTTKGSPRKTVGTVSVEDGSAKKRGNLRSVVKTEVVKSVEFKARDEKLDAEKPRRGRKRKEVADKPVEIPPKKKPQVVISAKPKPYNLYPKGNCRLDSFIEVKRELGTADLKHMKALYRLMYDDLPPRDIDELKNEILQFQGFTFNKRSDELDKRQKSLKKLPDLTVVNICKILDLKVGTKDDMISDIIKFLLKPIKIVFSAVDPFQPSLQPAVKLYRLSMDDKTTFTKIPVKSSKRKRIPSTRLSEYVSDVSFVLKTSEETESDEEKEPVEPSKPHRGRPRKKPVAPETENENLQSAKKRTAVESPRVSQKTQKTAVEKSKTPSKSSNMSTSGSKTPGGIPARRTELQKVLVAKANTSAGKKKAAAAIKPEPMSQDESSEVTLSSDEAKQEEARIVKRKKPIHRREGKPLSSFFQVKENILRANYSALQRLHILLFGTSDKVENLKANILAFGGFPFLEGSEEWKQKEFLLSLLAPNTLKEYLNLLCIEHSNDHGNPTLINKLMKFLAVPKENPPEEIITQVVSSEPVIQTPEHESDPSPYSLRTRNSTASNLKKTPDLEKEKGNVKKLSVKDLKELQNEYMDQKSKPKVSVKYCQANYCTNNSKDNPELTFFSYPTDPVRLEKWLTNIELKPSSKKYNLCLCSKHFDTRAFTNTTNTYRHRRLLTFAVPTIPPPGSTRKIVYPCLDGYASPDSSRLVYEPSGDKTETSTSTQSTTDISRVPLHKLMEDLTQKRTSASTPQTDSELLEALLQTVYKRRALKEAGAKVSIPNKGTHTRLGELDNVKFLVVTSNYNDLDVLHHLIYMTEATKSKVRKNILDFAGFNFAEDSTPYKDRMAFLQSLGYNISKRIAFLLGLCPYKLDIDQQDLNELIMYFLMSPCKSKQIPIRHLPQNFFTNGMPEELCSLLEKHGEPEPSPPKPLPDITSQFQDSPDSPPLPKSPPRARAKKSFRSSMPRERKAAPAKQATEPVKKPLGIGEKVPSPQVFPSTLMKPSPTSTTTTVKPSLPAAIPQSLLKGPPEDMGPQEFLIQQQTPDGQQKTYKLIRLPTTHPLNSSASPSPAVSPVVQSAPLRPPIPVPGAPLPPGIILFKNSPLRGAIVSPGGYMSPMNPSGITNKLASTGIIPPTGSPVPRIVTQTTPVIQLGAPNTPVAKSPASPATQSLDASTSKVSTSSDPEMTEDNEAPLDFDEEVEMLNPLEDSEPTDEELYDSIQELIHNSNFEDITLRNVIDRVSAQYAAFDLKKRHGYMKECVKKIIIGA